jgi:flagellar FliL protein
MVINPNETEGMRYLVVSMGVQLNNQGSLEDVQRNEVIIKDAVNTLLSQKTVQQLQDVESRMTLKQEVGVVINSILDDNAVRNVFFTKYVMQ